ncbi:MAG: hypothetical protein JST58_05045 [Bacteroidetes bacterium]|nr:hypothetical protein [Bacteroidota bacterium]
MNYSEYAQRRKDLFERWEDSTIDFENYEFTWDGIVCSNEEEWNKWKNSPIKILFLLKETFGGYHPMNTATLNISKPFSYNIALWSYVIDTIFRERKLLTEVPSIKKLKPDTTSIAIVEVKKCNQERSESVNSDIINYAKRDRSYLKEQIDLISPQVVFCCSTIDSYDIIYEDSPEDILLAREGNVKCWKQSNNRLIVDFYHPSYNKFPGGPKALFDLLCKLLGNGSVYENFDWGKK